MQRWRAVYGAGSFHLIGFVLCVVVSGLAIRHVFDAGAYDTVRVSKWFGGAIVAHDLLLLPLYSLVDRLLPASIRVYLRVPLILSGLMLLVFFPLILRRSAGAYGDASGQSPHVYLSRWLIATGVLFALSAVVGLVRGVGSRRSRTRREP